ncbi:hypothetical protein [Xanthomonas theicola]|uniref:Uncharacterized protein n=1 Tax=Xanthomonas theicola TaxID=56464 RepID=A0A2S6ZGL1_9XANT|nr:hypothetical protein [Xanthomonas theicola]PPT91398.1 hypothetical protein XthCFBP4691_07645 [Xanthomonas theicola]QNH27200.1 hypothetical protein G4Q83_22275 [Xanthomonas theicola]
MSTLDKLWKGISETIKLNDKVEQLSTSVSKHQQRIEGLTERITRLEARYDTTVQIAGLLQGRRQD